MKVLCSSCEAAEASVLCCADEAALCAACDRAVHTANRLAGKHHRLALRNPGGGCGGPDAAGAPMCDICQESSGYFFCLQDRAVLCRNCDIAVHTANEYVTAHSRFLLTGVQVGLDSSELSFKDQIGSAVTQRETSLGLVKTKSVSSCGEHVDQVRWAGTVPSTTLSAPDVTATRGMPTWSVPNKNVEFDLKSSGALSSPTKRPAMEQNSSATHKAAAASGNYSGQLPDWPLDEIFGYMEYSNSFGFSEHGSSKADSGRLGSSEGSHQYRSTEDPDGDEFLGQVPELSCRAPPEFPSPPTASGLYWQKNPRRPRPDNAAFVPDISSIPARAEHRLRR